MDAPVIVAGIDEAGYGPLLGPLVVSATAFEVPRAQADACLWKTLKKSVCNKVTARGRRIPILDSKKLYQRAEGLGALERSVLATMHPWRGSPPTLRGLLQLVSVETLGVMDDYPWYRAADPPLPVACDGAVTRIRGGQMARDMEDQAVRAAGMWSEVVLEAQYNRLVTNTNNKAVTLFGVTLRLIQRIANAYPDRDLFIFIDKQGGRDHYAAPLMRSFEERHLRIVEEAPDHGVYEMTDAGSPRRGGSTWRISFRQEGESHHLTTALASLLSKYLRELFMHCFNDWWGRQVPGVKPTAGYYGDGQRFVRDIDAHLPRLGIERTRLVRER